MQNDMLLLPFFLVVLVVIHTLFSGKMKRRKKEKGIPKKESRKEKESTNGVN